MHWMVCSVSSTVRSVNWRVCDIHYILHTMNWMVNSVNFVVHDVYLTVCSVLYFMYCALNNVLCALYRNIVHCTIALCTHALVDSCACLSCQEGSSGSLKLHSYCIHGTAVLFITLQYTELTCTVPVFSLLYFALLYCTAMH